MKEIDLDKILEDLVEPKALEYYVLGDCVSVEADYDFVRKAMKEAISQKY